MALSTRARHLCNILFGNNARGKEVADAIDAAAAGVAVALKVQPNAVSGTDQAGTDTLEAGGQGTGAGVGGDIIRKGAFAGSTGSTANALVERGRTINRRKTIANAGSNLLDVTLNAGDMASFTVKYGIRCSDGTDFQAIAGVVNVAAVNKGGTYTFTATDSSACLAASTGTLTLAWSKVNGTNKITLKLTPTTSLTATTFDITLEITNHTGTPIAVL